ncbi:hypothetical protein ID866_10985, partial [Astraeus odoratus]
MVGKLFPSSPYVNIAPSCMAPGHAPAFLAYERLPGGWYGVAMEYVANAVPVTLHMNISAHFERWKTGLQRLVAAFHSQGFVHGDLHDANIEGEVSYPNSTLNPELFFEAQPSEDLKITQEDDRRILQRTLAKILAHISYPYYTDNYITEQEFNSLPPRLQEKAKRV